MGVGRKVAKENKNGLSLSDWGTQKIKIKNAPRPYCRNLLAETRTGELLPSYFSLAISLRDCAQAPRTRRFRGLYRTRRNTITYKRLPLRHACTCSCTLTYISTFARLGIYETTSTHLKKAPPTRGRQETRSAKNSSFSDEVAATILKSGE